MISNYRFEDVEMQNSFEEGVTDMIYFPVTDSEDFPTEIRKKTEEIIDHIIHAHKLDISKLRLNARIIVYSDANCDWLNEISVLISDYSAFDDVWIEEEYSIGHEDPLYEPFKAYVMKRLGKYCFSADCPKLDGEMSKTDYCVFCYYYTKFALFIGKNSVCIQFLWIIRNI